MYLLGPACHTDAVQLSRSTDGIHWPPHDRRTVLTAAPGMTFTNAPTTVVQANGKVYRAVETVTKASNTAWGSSLILFATIPITDETGSGLLDAVWTASKPLPFAKGWPAAAWPPVRWGGEWGAKGFLEGGAVAVPRESGSGNASAEIRVVLRLDILSTSVAPSEAIMLRYDEPTNGRSTHKLQLLVVNGSTESCQCTTHSD